MMTFWILAIGLTGLAMLFVLPPILRSHRADEPAGHGTLDEDQVNLAVFRQQLEELDADLAAGNLDQEQYDAARRDLEKELLLDIDETATATAPKRSGRWAAPTLLVTVPALAVALYLTVGHQDAIERLRAAPAQAATHPATDGTPLPDMEVLVQRLAERMEQNPDNLEGWVMLGRSYLAIGQDRKAVAAYERARKLAPNDTDLLLGYAEALAKTRKSLQGKPAELIASVLALEPGNPNGLWMMGLAEYQGGQPAKALEHWSRLQAQLQPGGADAATLEKYMAQAREAAGIEASPAATPAVATGAPGPEAPAQPVAVADAKAIQVAVSLAPALQAKTDPGDTLFIFARALSGPPMPLAAKRLAVADLPVSITLDDAMAMMPQMRLSNFEQVVVGARISRSGTPMPQSGDLEGEVQPVTPGQAGTVQLVIDSVRP